MAVTCSWLFSLFTMQTKASNFANAITFGRAGYVATGRGFQMETISVHQLYANYAGTHIYFGMEIGYVAPQPCHQLQPRHQPPPCATSYSPASSYSPPTSRV